MEPAAVIEVSVVVPTLGLSPWLAACLEALRRQEGVGPVEILVVDQAPRPLALPPGLADRVLRPGRNLGFAGGTNLGLAAAAGELVATVNDDAVVGAGWLATLAAALRADPGAAAVQGINLLADAWEGQAAAEDDAAAAPRRPASAALPGGSGPPGSTGPQGMTEPRHVAAPPGDRIDGCGLGWNRWWQAIQLGHGEPAPPPAPPPAPGGRDMAEVFGVSATAALFRRSALERVARGGQVFDAELVSYYEDVELAGRLRAAGFRALLAPAARARHAGSASGRAAPASRERWRLIYGNRYLAAARLLGRGFWPRLPRMALRDLLDLLAPLAPRGRGSAGPGHRSGPGTAGAASGRPAGIVAGWGRALRHLPAFARRGAPSPPPAEVARLSRWPAYPE